MHILCKFGINTLIQHGFIFTAVPGRAMSIATLSLWPVCLGLTLSLLTLVRMLLVAGRHSDRFQMPEYKNVRT
jgi:hypothetical protein